MTLNWINDQPWDFYNALIDANDPVLEALDAALNEIEAAPDSPRARQRKLAAVISPPPLWLVDVRHSTRDLQILWQEDDHGEPMLLWIGDARFPRFGR
ncbi:hypothetical protein [Mycobacteroides immunogenum]|uniref:Transposase n=1 Tax=Mycobacteroides immunogenum TaxID=83262 RepID=A0ABR5LKJ3_9MYCO|nr:hypothetical protein [Mycobacteroides immunogenum]KPG26237.1 hypothetical protein AN912_25670 [Mycobacteroides immunogenum]KPG26311.1 hypothetical protein AN913_21355 [Mycobacteroides immunogenum]KPG31817.1 hypothetical protein AN914_25950 [Mycobacteroides immunogenum]KPG39706.1 hypothetical protein AN915_26600 [Mycobacteroides immunogenum]KPG57288.1 hypothetical protein AN918_26480 [Mycobacteroides immunogenum]